MATFLLIRHALADHVGRFLAGRTPGIPLNDAGRAQVERLSRWLAPYPVQRIYSSPLQRARETAEPLARRLGIEVSVADAVTEIDFGDWTGKSFDELSAEARWPHFNTFRSGTRIPGGELMLEAQTRIVAFLQRLHDEHPTERIAVVSHGDAIKAAVAHYLGVPLDLFQRIEISPASVSGLRIEDHGPHVLFVNTQPALTHNSL